MSSLQDKFRGAMLGALAGDCIGFPLEYCVTGDMGEIDFKRVQKHFKVCSQLPSQSNKYGVSSPPLDYTDDTAMARQVAASLIACSGVNHADLARRFTEEYYGDGKTNLRGYGLHVRSVFHELWQQDNYLDPLTPSRKQFDGSGSYGNGAAMRVHPVALFCHGQSQDVLVETAKATSLVTHSHKDGYNGAVLQAAAVSMALADKPVSEMAAELAQLAKKLEGSSGSYHATMQRILEQIAEGKKAPKPALGNGVAAPESVPTAIYAFLRGMEAVEGLDPGNAFVRILQLAISFGGDTDTIGTMAGAIAGARLGAGAIPGWMTEKCDGVMYAVMLADKMHDVVRHREV